MIRVYTDLPSREGVRLRCGIAGDVLDECERFPFLRREISASRQMVAVFTRGFPARTTDATQKFSFFNATAVKRLCTATSAEAFIIRFVRHHAPPVARDPSERWMVAAEGAG